MVLHKIALLSHFCAGSDITPIFIQFLKLWSIYVSSKKFYNINYWERESKCGETGASLDVSVHKDLL